MWSGDFDKARDFGAQALAAARATGQVDKEAEALITYASGLAYLGEAEAALVHLHEALELAERAGAGDTLMRAYINYSDCLEAFGRHRELSDIAARGVAAAEELGFARSWGAFLNANQAEPLLRLGRLDDADRTVAATRALDPAGIFSAAGEMIFAEVALQRGEIDQAARHVEAVRREFHDPDPGWQYEIPIHYLWGEIRRARGDLAGARDELWAMLTRPCAPRRAGTRGRCSGRRRAPKRKAPWPPPAASRTLTRRAGSTGCVTTRGNWRSRLLPRRPTPLWSPVSSPVSSGTANVGRGSSRWRPAGAPRNRSSSPTPSPSWPTHG